MRPIVSEKIGPERSGPSEFQQESLGLAVPTASEASAMEAATHAMAPKTSNMCDTHTVCEAAPAEMSGTKAAIHTYGATHAMTETVTSEMGGTYAAAETHSVMRDGPLGAYAHVAEAVMLTIEHGRIAVIAIIIRTSHGAAVSRIVDGAGRASVLAGIGLGSSRLRSSKVRSPRQ